MTLLIQKPIKRVAIIGGGPGGLAAARALRNENSFETITIFERNDHTGGTWYVRLIHAYQLLTYHYIKEILGGNQHATSISFYKCSRGRFYTVI
jgi:cation diffusion facilitator CzcD-associated flavoprotein CzcO